MRPSAIILAAAVVAMAAAPAHASRRLPPIASQAVRTECGACHMVYPPQFLSRASWQKVMASLSNHFGEDASLSPSVTDTVRRYLMDNAADSDSSATRSRWHRWADATAPLRITETRRWRRMHREIRRTVWSDPLVRSKAHCNACHAGATQGVYDEDGVHMPTSRHFWSSRDSDD